jgi:hypothetical protein
MRKKIAVGDAMGLADALSLQGLYFSRYGIGNSTEAIIAAYREALDLFDNARRERSALESADREFALGGKTPQEGQEAGPGDTGEGHGDSYMASSTEPYVPFVMTKAVVGFAEEAIEQGRAPDAEQFLVMASSLVRHAENIHKFMSSAWPCHLSMGLLDFWKAKLHATRLLYIRKFHKDGEAQALQEFRAASALFERVLAIFKYSQGGDSALLRDLSTVYQNLLRANGRPEEASKLEEAVTAPAPQALDADGTLAGWGAVPKCPLEADRL